MKSNSDQLMEALHDIVEGRAVKRSKHELIFQGNNVTEAFIETLRLHQYLPGTVDDIDIKPGERVPAFYIEDHTAYFGWVFWEKFTELRLRKLFGTVVRNPKGDWLIQLPPKSPKIIYVNRSTIFEMDIDRPFEL
ncbi:MAG: hypothetical protein HYV29_01450 [Ignavibacteriales bacterium]|nr:hypothetical protein [Ignavibacteriales bacterium]